MRRAPRVALRDSEGERSNEVGELRSSADRGEEAIELAEPSIDIDLHGLVESFELNLLEGLAKRDDGRAPSLGKLHLLPAVVYMVEDLDEEFRREREQGERLRG